MERGEDTIHEPMFIAVKVASERFTEVWRNHEKKTTVEEFLDSVPEMLSELGIATPSERDMRLLMGELIRVEIACRLSRGEEVQPEEFARRFPGYELEIENAFRGWGDVSAPSCKDSMAFSLDEPLAKTAAGHNSTVPLELKLDAEGNESVPLSVGQYHQIRMLGEGSFGIVCSAFDSERLVDVALKFPRQRTINSPDRFAMFCEEGKRTQALVHPRIARTYSLENVDGYVFLVQQLVLGGTLKESLSVERSFQQVAELVAMIADGLSYANLQGLVHRDLKPANILLDLEGKPLIADFGMALDENQQLGAANTKCGTVSYMSPQMAEGLTRNLDGRADIWSLGVIFYELLTGRKPFLGRDPDHVVQQIRQRDPKPLRQIRPEIPRELERICLKCLAKPARERYLTASDVAEDLRHWVSHPAAEARRNGEWEFVPKGLRSYGAEDAAFFQSLLPGPKDRMGVPASINFWRHRIMEPLSQANTTPVGVIYGPSGSGKSSFVKAGLLPTLGKQVRTVYVECTQERTETQLISAVEREMNVGATGETLPGVFEGIAKDESGGDRKLLVVLDQFEQWLASGTAFRGSDLAHALKFCDGQRLQVLLLVRDDYWRSLTRFMDVLEVDLREGQNTQSINLFDREHARSVLQQLGAAYGRLPAPPEPLPAGASEFLDEVVEQISENDLVVCIRLTLFAEWFKHLPWTLEQLEAVGGATGSATKYLEAAFDHAQSPRKLRDYRTQVQAVLRTLLPETKTDLKNTRRCGLELMEEAGLSEAKDFQQVIGILRDDLRLITEAEEFQESGKETGLLHAHYQLMHDFLVPPLRQWLRQDLALTPGGRARLRLADLAENTSKDQLNRIKVSHWEWLNWLWHLRGQTLKGSEREIMNSGRRDFFRNTGRLAVASALVGVPTIWISNRYINETTANGLIGDLLGHEWHKLPEIVEELANYQSFVEPKLREIASNGKPEEQFRAQLGMLGIDAADRTVIRDFMLLRESRPEVVAVIAELLGMYPPADTGLFQEFVRIQQLEDFSSPPGDLNLEGARVLRWLAFLSQYHDGDLVVSPAVELVARLGIGLEGEPTSDHVIWLQLLKPLADKFPDIGLHFLGRFNDTPPPQHTVLYSLACFELLPEAERAKLLLAGVVDWNDLQFDSVFKLFEQQDLRGELLQASRNLDTSAPQSLALHATIKLRLGTEKDYRLLLQSQDDLLPRSFAVFYSTAMRVNFESLKQLYAPWKTNESREAGQLRSGLLQAMAQQLPDLLPEQSAWLKSVVLSGIAEDHHSGCYSAADLIARRNAWDTSNAKTRRLKQSEGGRLGSVVLLKNGMAFAVIEMTNKAGKKYEVAVCNSPVTSGQVPGLAGPLLLPQEKAWALKRPDTAYSVPTMKVAWRFCNQLSVAEGLPKFFDEKGKIPTGIDVSKEKGYRLLSEEEAEVIQADAWKALDTENVDVANLYVWNQTNMVMRNAKNETPDCCDLLPDHNGIYDWIGGLQESVVDYDKATSVAFSGCDGFYRQAWSAMYQNRREAISNPFATSHNFLGFRVCRTLK